MTAIASQLSTFSIKVGSAAAIIVEGFTDFSGVGGGSPAVMDASDLSSPFKQKVVSIPDEGQGKFLFTYQDGGVGQAAMRTARANRSRGEFKITFSNGDSIDFFGYVLTWEHAGGNGKIVTISSTVEIDGASTFTAHT